LGQIEGRSFHKEFSSIFFSITPHFKTLITHPIPKNSSGYYSVSKKSLPIFIIVLSRLFYGEKVTANKLGGCGNHNQRQIISSAQ
jgi:drug/metabolite transporter (DMT)-like permease